jgi:type I restriction enzyme S subunit
MAGEWSYRSIADAPIEIVDGDRGTNYPKQEDFSRAGNVKQSGFDFSDCAFISKQKDESLRKGKLQRHDVVLTTRGTVGNVALFDDSVPFQNVRINSGMVLLRADPAQLSQSFLFQYVRSPLFKEQVAALTTGSAQPQLPIRDIRRVEIPLPPLPEQKAIASILGALDDKIELNRRMNTTLEAMARALFQSWFVDFDPVRAKLDGRQPAGLDPATAALFPASFQDSPLGPIPQGWTVEPLRNLCSYLSRGIGPSYIDEGGIPVLNQKCVRDHRVDFTLARRHDSARKPVTGRTLRKNDILVNSTGQGTLGRVAQILAEPGEAIVDSHITVVRHAENVSPTFLGVALLGREADIESLAEGSTGQTELSRTRLGDLLMLNPSTELHTQFGRHAEALFSYISSNDIQIQSLAATRDLLLPALLTGALTTR